MQAQTRFSPEQAPCRRGPLSHSLPAAWGCQLARRHPMILMIEVMEPLAHILRTCSKVLRLQVLQHWTRAGRTSTAVGRVHQQRVLVVLLCHLDLAVSVAVPMRRPGLERRGLAPRRAC